MTALLAGRDASIGGDGAARYARHRAEQTLLHQSVGAYIPGPHPVGDLRSSNFIPDEIVTAYSRCKSGS